MLTSIMRILALKESLSVTQLARKVGCSVREIESALEQMEHMGYIRSEKLSQSCSSGCSERDGKHCEGCSFASPEIFTFWVLTERGEKMVNTKLD